MVQTCQVQHTMHDKNAQFGEQWVAVFRCLTRGGLDGDGQIACHARNRVCGEAQYIRRLVLVTKPPIEGAQAAIIREQYADLALQIDETRHA